MGYNEASLKCMNQSVIYAVYVTDALIQQTVLYFACDVSFSLKVSLNAPISHVILQLNISL